jgi:hypothetical protein
MIRIGKMDADAMPLLHKLYRIITQAETVEFAFDSFFSQLSYIRSPHDSSGEPQTSRFAPPRIRRNG